MSWNVVITGVGGQGNVLASQILGKVAVKKGYSVTIGETFGLSQRGGPVMSHVRLHKGEILAPTIPNNSAHVIVGLEPLETIRVVPELANQDTIFLVNSRPIFPLNVIAGEVEYPDPEWIRVTIAKVAKRLHWVNATELAMALGGAIYLNSIMLGALVSIDEFPLGYHELVSVFNEMFEGDRLSRNLEALNLGRNLIKS